MQRSVDGTDPTEEVNGLIADKRGTWILGEAVAEGLPFNNACGSIASDIVRYLAGSLLLG